MLTLGRHSSGGDTAPREPGEEEGPEGVQTSEDASDQEHGWGPPRPVSQCTVWAPTHSPAQFLIFVRSLTRSFTHSFVSPG